VDGGVVTVHAPRENPIRIWALGQGETPSSLYPVLCGGRPLITQNSRWHGARAWTFYPGTDPFAAEILRGFPADSRAVL